MSRVPNTMDAPAGRAPAAARLADIAQLTERIRALRDALLTGLVERDVAVRLALIGALAGEHLLLLGPPGTAKSLVAQRLKFAFADARYFERLLTRFTVPEELFGPLSIKGLEDDRYERQTASYLPTASIAFLDEIFKANSAILNALLTLLNERQFDNGTRREKAPLIAVIGASNELPEGEELDALFDRFLLRLHVGPVSNEGFRALIGLRGDGSPVVSDALKLTSEDLARVQAVAEVVDVPDDVVALLRDLREWCAAESIPVSDRRWRKIVKLLQTSALTNGRSSVSVWDCWLLQHCVWNVPDEREKVYGWYAERVGASAAMDPSRLTRIVVSWESQLKADQEARAQARDSDGRLLYKGLDGKSTPNARGTGPAIRGTEALFLAPSTAIDRQHNPLKDRTNGGRGYTVAELNSVELTQRNHYGSFTFQQWNSRDSYLADPNNRLIIDADLPAIMEPMRHKEVHIDACAREVDDIHAQVQDYMGRLDAHVASLEAEIRHSLWVTSDFVAPATSSLESTRREVEGLLVRLVRVRQGFELLPREGGAGPIQSPRTAPSPGGTPATKRKARADKQGPVLP